MAIKQTQTPSHWNYFLSLESDLHALSRYVEFTKDNFACYSIELARIILAACSEVDVVAKQICNHVKKDQDANNIHTYRDILRPIFLNIERFQVLVKRHGLELAPWTNWAQGETPDWWGDHNDVKHERHVHFQKANLSNALNSVAGLYVMVLYLYREQATEGLLSPSPFLFIASEEFLAGYNVDGVEGTLLYHL